jgi:hypothetical protein
VTKISYGRGVVSYSTFDRESTDVLRLDFDVTKVSAGGTLLARRSDSAGLSDREGFVFDPSTRVLRIHHQRSADVRIEGVGGSPTPLFVTFDDPHQPPGTILKGEYPAGIIAWDADSWAIHVPSGKLATFNLAATRENATFQLRAPRVFAGVDVYNPGAAQATLSVRCQEAGEITTTVDPGAIKRLRTGWHSPCSRVTFASSAGAELQFDNLAYLP